MNGRDQGTFIVQYGTNAERLALDAAGIKPLTAWYETDTGNEYKWFGVWVAYPGAAKGGGGGGGLTKKQALKLKTSFTICMAGDSTAENGINLGLGFPGATNVTGIGGAATAPNGLFASLTCPTGNGLIEYQASTKSLRWTAPGDTAGAWTPVTDGIFFIQSGTAGYALKADVTLRLLPVADASDTLASGTRYCRYNSGSKQGMLDAFTGHRFTWLQNMGIGGQYSADVLARVAQIVALKPDIIYSTEGTNDAVAAVLAASVFVPTRAAIWDAYINAGIYVVAAGIGARFGTDYGAQFYGTINGTTLTVVGSVVGGTIAATQLLSGSGVTDSTLINSGSGSTWTLSVSQTAATTIAMTSGGVTGVQDYSHYTASAQANIVDGNKGYAAAAAARYGINFVNAGYNRVVDPFSAKGRARPGYKAAQDGLHDGGASCQEEMIQSAAILNAQFPAGVGQQNVGNASQYDATNNKGGNLMGAGIGNFTGTTGTNSTGATAAGAWATLTAYTAPDWKIANNNLYQVVGSGTTGAIAPSHLVGDAVDGTVVWRFVAANVTSGLATGWSLNRSTGSSMTGVTFKMADPDGGPDWQGIAWAGATAAIFEEWRLFPGTTPTIGNFTTNDLIDSSVQWKSNGLGIYGLRGDHVLTGGLLATWDAFQCDKVVSGLRGNGTLGFIPLPWPAGVTVVQPRLFFSSQPGTSAQIYFRSYDMHKIVGA